MLVLLPLAWITGSAWYDRLASWLFRATRQTPSRLEPELIEKISQPFAVQGMLAEHKLVDLGTSQVLLILAHKSNEK
jgi:hypothetical protein